MARIPTAEITVNGKRKIVNADDPRAAGPDQFSREGIMRMKKSDVLDLLDVHGVNADPRARLGELRKMLVHVMFAEG